MEKVLEGTAQAKTQRGGTLWHCSAFLIQTLPLSILFPPTLTEGKGPCSTRGEFHRIGLLGAVAQEWAASLTMVPGVLGIVQRAPSLSCWELGIHRLVKVPKIPFPKFEGDSIVPLTFLLKDEQPQIFGHLG